MKLRLLLLITVLALSFISSPVHADSSATITVIATGYVTTGPTGLVLTYVNDWEVGISWTSANGSVGTMVRAAYGHQPSSPTDGYLVYNGSASNCSDTAVSLTGSESVYYSAWAIEPDGSYSLLYSTESSEEIMSMGFLFLGWILLAGVLTYIATRVHFILFRLAPALAWTGLGIWLLIGNVTNLGIGDAWTQVLGFVFIVMAIGCLALQMMTDTKHEQKVRDAFGKEKYVTTTEWNRKRKPGKPSSSDRQAAYRMQVRGTVDRGRQRTQRRNRY